MFPAIYSTSIRAGERSGDLEGVLKRFLKYQKMIVNLRKKVVGAMVYPGVLVAMSVGMIFVMLTFVIPKFAEFFTGFGAELPWFTVLMINLATGMRKNVWLVLGIVIVAAFLLRRWAAPPAVGCCGTASSCASRSWAAFCTASPSCSSRSRSARC